MTWMGIKGDLRDFKCGMFVGARWAGINISEYADLLGFSNPTISKVYRERPKKEKISNKCNFSGRERPVDARGKRRMVRLL